MTKVFEVKNTTGGDIELKEFGLIIPTLTTVDLSSHDRACCSVELDGFLSSGDLVKIVDGVEIPYALAYLTPNDKGFRVAPIVDGTIRVLGWNIKTDEAESLVSATPVTMATPAFHSHIILDVSAGAGMPFTIRLTGTSVDESTGTTTPADTEDISVSANGYYQSTKSWIDAVQVSIVEGAKSCTVDIYRCTYWDKGNKDFVLTGCRFEWTPSASSWSIQLKVLKVNNDGSITEVDNKTFTDGDTPPRADADEPGKYKRGNYSVAVDGDTKEGLILEVVQSDIVDFFLEVKYND